MEANDLKMLMELFSKLPIGEMKFESGDHSLFLSKPSSQIPMGKQSQAPTITTVTQQKESMVKEEQNDNLSYVTSPIVGTFYTAANPKALPYVKPGDSIKEGQILCIIEAMKLMNEIQAECSGVIHEILVDNAQPVEFGQKLFSFKN